MGALDVTEIELLLQKLKMLLSKKLCCWNLRTLTSKLVLASNNEYQSDTDTYIMMLPSVTNNTTLCLHSRRQTNF